MTALTAYAAAMRDVLVVNNADKGFIPSQFHGEFATHWQPVPPAPGNLSINGDTK
jgi:hypothetical protein